MTTIEMVLPAAGEPDVLQARYRELGPVGPGRARVRVEATGVSFAEQAMRRGVYHGQPAFPFVPGYDLVGVVEELGGGDTGLVVGQRVAALTKTGGWAEEVLLDAADLVPVPATVGAAEAETVVVNGVTALRVLRRITAAPGDTVVVLGAAGGVGSVLVQLALRRGLRVIGTAGPTQQERLRGMGVIPIDYRAEDVAGRVRELAPGGVAGVVDHVGGPGVVESWRMLARGGRLIGLSDMSVADAAHPVIAFLRLYLRLQVWNLLPNGRGAAFFDVWAGHRRHPDRFRRELRADLTHLFGLLADGSLDAPIHRTFPLREAAAALRHAEGGGIGGKIVLLPEGR